MLTAANNLDLDIAVVKTQDNLTTFNVSGDRNNCGLFALTLGIKAALIDSPLGGKVLKTETNKARL
jgi:hypothetical protein